MIWHLIDLFALEPAPATGLQCGMREGWDYLGIRIQSDLTKRLPEATRTVLK
jgi:hypothetical protein